MYGCSLSIVVGLGVVVCGGVVMGANMGVFVCTYMRLFFQAVKTYNPIHP